MFKTHWIVLGVLLFLLFYVIANRNMIIMEHLNDDAKANTYIPELKSSPAPTPESQADQIALLQRQVSKLTDEVDQMKRQAKDQSSQAAAAQASLQAIN
jgi:hypothetical protein